ncbi:MAG: DUF106 domain-containing protein [Halolamina sp.]
MARTEQKVEDLLSEDGDIEGALQTVLDAADDGEVRWVDVRDDITSGEWGRLIEKGILVDGESGFEVADPDSVETALDGNGDADVDIELDFDDAEEPEGTSWSIYDKGAAAITVSFFVAYSWEPLRNVIGGAVDVVLGPVNSVLPFYATVMVIAIGTGLYSTLLRALLMDMDKMAYYQDRMQEIQDKRKEAKERGDDEALEAIQDEQMEAMGDQLGMFKEQFRPMVWIMFLTIPAFLWMYWKIGIRGGVSHGEFQNIVLPLVGSVQWTASVAGPIQTWIVWYFLCSMAFTQVIQKALDISMSPTSS